MPVSCRTLIASTALISLFGGAALAEPLMSPEALSELLGAEGVTIIDVRTDFTDDSAETFVEGHVPGAVYADYKKFGWRATVDGVMGNLPPVETIEAKIQSLGVDAGDQIVIVNAGEGALDMGAAARVYWTFKTLGHDNVTILEGGFQAWEEGGFEIATGEAPTETGTFAAQFQPAMVADSGDAYDAIGNDVVLVDARPPAYFQGESQASMVARAGTIPTAVNFSAPGLFVDNALQDAATIAEKLVGMGYDADAEQIVFCNTGHHASLAWFVLSEVMGDESVTVYDGSMTDWTMDPARPVLNGG